MLKLASSYAEHGRPGGRPRFQPDAAQKVRGRFVQRIHLAHPLSPARKEEEEQESGGGSTGVENASQVYNRRRRVLVSTVVVVVVVVVSRVICGGRTAQAFRDPFFFFLRTFSSSSF